MRRIACLLVLLVAACGSVPRQEGRAPGQGPASQQGIASQPGAPAGGGRYYKDDGPGANPPANLDTIADAVPRAEPLNRFANRPYSVLGRDYVPATTLRAYRERGIASWYGRKFHGQKTSTGETYDMYAMTAAHPTLPLPSYARVTNVANGRSVIVRVNDRGPFLHDRVIDLSYAAAYRLGIAQAGSGEVEVESILPGAAATSVTASVPLPPVARPSTIARAGDAAAPVSPQPDDPIAAFATMDEPPAAVTVANAAPPAPPTTVAVANAAPPTPPTTVALANAAPSLPPPDAPARTPEPVPANGGYAVQLAAFASYANATNFVAHVQNQLAAVQVEARVRQSGGLYRVYVGPYADRDEARRVGERITQAFGFPTTIAAH